jgi:hypothetical protein
MRSGSMVLAAFVVLFAATVSAAQDARIGERSSDRPNILSTDFQPESTFFRVAGEDRTTPEELLKKSLPRRGESITVRNGPQREANECGHILIWEMPEIDPRMVKEVPKEFKTTMPILQGLPPCCRESRTVSKHWSKSGTFLK